MTIPSTPKVRDLTRGRRSLPIDVQAGSMYELLMTLWLAFDDSEEHKSFEIGADWFRGIVEATPDDLRREIHYLGGGKCVSWSALRGLVARAPAQDIDAVLDWLDEMEPAEFRRGLLAYSCGRAPRDDEEIERALAGDATALAELLEPEEELADYYQTVFSLEQGELKRRMIGALRRFRDEVYAPHEEEFARTTAKAAAGAAALATGADPERVIEAVTNGLDYRIQPGVSRLILVPSVVLRPWAVIDSYQDLLLVAFPVAEEYVTADADAPPPWVVRAFKALADDKRLRILRRLAEAPSTLDDLAEVLDLTKSTVHHHVGLLRSAGLVRVVVDPVRQTKTYALRPAILPGVWEAVDQYLTVPEEEQQVRSQP
jgi:DNA-binding transcriptional ArsR family regulator